MKEILERHGCTPYEADIYLCLLQNGRLSAYEVAEKTGLYRQACYDALNRLAEKGYVTSLTSGRVRLFKAADPSMVLELLREGVASFEDVLPQLLALQQESTEPVDVQVFTGSRVVWNAFEDVMSTLKAQGGENCCTSVDEQHAQLAFNPVLERYHRFMLENGFHERIIIKQGVRPYFPPEMSTYRAVPARFFNSNPTEIYGDHVQILLGGAPNVMILIKSKGIADSFRKQFELMWSVAKPINLPSVIPSPSRKMK